MKHANTLQLRSVLGDVLPRSHPGGRRLRRANRKLRRAIRRLAKEEGDSAEFVLSNAPPKPKPWRGGEPENTRQTVLIAGMDCLAGQQDLFETDGEAARMLEDE